MLHVSQLTIAVTILYGEAASVVHVFNRSWVEETDKWLEQLQLFTNRWENYPIVEWGNEGDIKKVSGVAGS